MLSFYHLGLLQSTYYMNHRKIDIGLSQILGIPLMLFIQGNAITMKYCYYVHRFNPVIT